MRSALQAVEAAPKLTFTATTWRHTAPGRPPLSGLGALRFGGRWNPPDSSPTIYLALTVEACVAEFLRMAEGQGKGASSFLPRDLHEIEVHGMLVCDLRDTAALASVDLNANDLADEDRSRCQAVGEAALLLGLDGLLAPSATGTGDVLAVFDPPAHGEFTSVRTSSLDAYLAGPGGHA